MNICDAPPTLTDLQLAMIMDGEASPALRQHLAACPACQARAATLAQQQRDLATNLYRSRCPTPEEMRDYQMGLASRSDQSNIGLHVARCPDCSRELFILNDFMHGESVQRESTDATQARHPTATPTWRAQIKLFVATLINPPSATMATSALAGQRGDASTLRLYQANDIQIGLELVDDPSRGTKTLNGLITSWGTGDDTSSDIPSELLAHLWRDGALIATAVVDPMLGDFHFTGLPVSLPANGDEVAEYELIVSAQQTKLRLPHLRFDDGITS